MNSKNLNIFKNKEDFLKKFKNNDLAVNCEAVDEANDFLKFWIVLIIRSLNHNKRVNYFYVPNRKELLNRLLP